VDSSNALLIWVLVVSGVLALILILTVGAVLWVHQRQLAEQARAWGRHLLAAQDEERHNIARDLHDDIVQRLASVQMRLDPDADGDPVQLLGEVIRDLRALARGLYPPALSSVSLGEALRDLVAQDSSESAPVITVACDDEIVLPKAAALALYRVAQEAQRNMQKHSNAQRATMSLVKAGSWVELTLHDNGGGFVPSEVAVRSFGLRSMRERLELVGGSLAIGSAPDKGTTIVARVPAQ
jgi:two-component system NarL family sensor kinase